MKIPISLLFLSCLLFFGCSTVQTDVAKAQTWLNSSQGQTAEAMINSGAAIAIKLLGGKNAAAEGAALQGVDIFAGTISTGTAPTTAQISGVLTGLGVSSTTAGVVSPAASGAIQLAIANGLSPVAATTAVNSLVQAAGAKISSSGQP